MDLSGTDCRGAGVARHDAADRSDARPRPDAQAGRGPAVGDVHVEAVVKWFDPVKGYGFVNCRDGREAFLHSSVISRAGGSPANIKKGATVMVAVALEPRNSSLRVTSMLISSDADPAGMPINAAAPPGSVAGTVKWYDPEKGYGFIMPDDGGKDIFVHSSALRRSNLDSLPDDSRVMVEVRQMPRGPEALRMTISS